MMDAISTESQCNLYLDLIHKVLLNTIYEDPSQDPWSGQTFDPRKRERGLDWPSQAHTMISNLRMKNLRRVIETLLINNTPGDLIETGAWRGGACIYMRAILKAYSVTDRRVFVADSFEGLPRPNETDYPADRGDQHYTFAPLAISLEEVRSNFARYDLLDDQVIFLKGWFKDTLPTAPVEHIALLRLDGDMYESTMDGLVNLYDKVVPGGYIIVDDYGAVPACAQAIQDFRIKHNLTEPIHEIDGVGVFWQRGGNGELANIKETPSVAAKPAKAPPTRKRAKTPVDAPSYYGFLRPEVQALVPNTARRILDVGCAGGALGAGLKKRQSCEVHGIEYVPEVAHFAEQFLDVVHVGDVLEIAQSLPKQYFDCIVMADVLEHLADPADCLKALLPCMAQGCKLVISIPNVRHWSVVRGLLEGNWKYEEAGILDKTHLRFFTRQSFEEMLLQNGFKPLEIQSTSIGMEKAPDKVLRSLRDAGLKTDTLKAESEAYQYLYVIEPIHVKKVTALTSILILTHNQIEHTRLCLQSIERNTPEPHELIVVDNGSTDGTLDLLRDWQKTHDNLYVISNLNNRGFSAGNNQALSIAHGEYIVFLNNDTILPAGWLGRMISVTDREPETRLVGPMSNFVSGPQLLQNVAYSNIDQMETFAQKRANEYGGLSQLVTRLVGFCLLAHRSVIERIGGLDERYGSGNFEDDDFCLRAALAGFEIRIALDTFVHHTGSQTFAGMGVDYRASMEGNWTLFKNKWGIPAETPIEAGYKLPQQLPAPAMAPVMLKDISEDHYADAKGRWWTAGVAKKILSWLSAPRWQDSDNWQPLIRKYIESCSSNDSSVLKLYAGELNDSDPNTVYEKISGLLEELGTDSDQCPEIEITSDLNVADDMAVILTNNAMDDHFRRQYADRCVSLEQWKPIAA